MSRYLLILSSLLLFACTKQSNEADTKTAEVTFQVEAENVEDTEKVFITGSHPKLGNWQADQVALREIKAGIWQIKLRLPKDYALEYKFTKGSWEKEALNKEGYTPANKQLKVRQDTSVKAFIPQWKEGPQNTFEGQITGQVAYHRELKPEGLKKRDLIVWLPPGYEQHPDKNYPVLYMHDGQNLFDPATSSFGTDWQLDESADSLIRHQLIEPLIIVGINNTTDRSAEYLPGDTARLYMKFITEQVKPLIDRSYRTLPQRTATGGSSAGGIMAFMLAWEYPEIFSKAMCMSPAFKIQHIDYVKDVEAYRGPKKEILIYADNGGKGLEERLQPGIDDMLEVLQDKGYEKGKDLIWVKAPEAEHSEGAWAERAPEVLNLFYGRQAL